MNHDIHLQLYYRANDIDKVTLSVQSSSELVMMSLPYSCRAAQCLVVR